MAGIQDNNGNGRGNGSGDDSAATTIIARDLAAQGRGEPRGGRITTYVCAECGGSLWQLEENAVLFFRCHTGHTFGPELLLQQKSELLEATLWAAVRTLVEKGTLTRQVANRLPAGADPEQRAVIEAAAALDGEYEAALRRLLEAWPNPSDQGRLVTEAMEKAMA